MHVQRRYVELASAYESPDEDENNEQPQCNAIRIDHEMLTLHYRYAACDGRNIADDFSYFKTYSNILVRRKAIQLLSRLKEAQRRPPLQSWQSSRADRVYP